jgi:hypothetical protein
MAPVSALAGPLHTKFIQGTTATFDFTLNVPAGKAVTVLNFFHWASGYGCDLYVKIGSNPLNVWTMNADHPNSPLNNKDLTIVGPALVSLVVQQNDACILSYKLFNN